jgi:hypothetical protein
MRMAMGHFWYIRSFPGTIKFTADHFDANWNNDRMQHVTHWVTEP